LNGKPNFGYQLDTYSFDEMRYINALIDYKKYKTTSQKVQKLFMANPYNLSFIRTDESKGVITVVPNLTFTALKCPILWGIRHSFYSD
jgi:hypothetical protein